MSFNPRRIRSGFIAIRKRSRVVKSHPVVRHSRRDELRDSHEICSIFNIDRLCLQSALRCFCSSSFLGSAWFEAGKNVSNDRVVCHVQAQKIAPEATRCFLRPGTKFNQKNGEKWGFPHRKRLIASRISTV